MENLASVGTDWLKIGTPSRSIHAIVGHSNGRTGCPTCSAVPRKAIAGDRQIGRSTTRSLILSKERGQRISHAVRSKTAYASLLIFLLLKGKSPASSKRRLWRCPDLHQLVLAAGNNPRTIH